jgi:hypothetical protein
VIEHNSGAGTVGKDVKAINFPTKLWMKTLREEVGSKFKGE